MKLYSSTIHFVVMSNLKAAAGEARPLCTYVRAAPLVWPPRSLRTGPPSAAEGRVALAGRRCDAHK